MNKKELGILLVLSALNFTHILDFMILMPLGTFIMPHFSIAAREFSVLVASYALSAGLSSLLFAFWANKYDRKITLILAYIGFLLGTLGCGLAPSFYFLLISRIVAGIFGGILGSQVIAIVSDLIAFERRGKAMGFIMSAFSLASIVGVPFSLMLANKFSWHAPFLLVVFLGLFIVPLLWWILPSLKAHINQKTEAKPMALIQSVFSDPIQRGALLFSSIMMFGHFLIIPYINPFLQFNKGFSPSFTPNVYWVGGVFSLFAANFAGKWADQYGKWKVCLYSVILSFPFILFVTTIPLNQTILVLGVFGLWFAFSTGRGVSSQALVSNVVKPELRGSFQSFNSFMQQIGTGLSSLVSGLIISSEPDLKLNNYAVLGILSILILSLSLVLGRKLFKAL
jgi:MFS transporter, DHA1 family, inner membrane transport protein